MRIPVICPNCAVYTSTDCIIYNGEYLDKLCIEPGDTLTDILKKINDNCSCSGCGTNCNLEGNAQLQVTTTTTTSSTSTTSTTTSTTTEVPTTTTTTTTEATYDVQLELEQYVDGDGNYFDLNVQARSGIAGPQENLYVNGSASYPAFAPISDYLYFQAYSFTNTGVDCVPTGSLYGTISTYNFTLEIYKDAVLINTQTVTGVTSSTPCPATVGYTIPSPEAGAVYKAKAYIVIP